ncbi:DUF3253 domain-containing protein [Pararhizobium sp. IMCC21322]|uniref:DUF3253 domain-containing protein n=1 Tax=Pararhizobium sp. IMCC21322 TaxID=3067903 RepID=UPI002740666A|nr:DUF3253 domain-containing protein [Pararhizobium sp. IMCC21322]
MDQNNLIDAKILELIEQRGADKTICPSEVARALAGSDEKKWRLLMKPIRTRAVLLAEQQEVAIRRKGKLVDPQNFKGVYRLGNFSK